jgi:hypothetical protein
MHEFLFFFSSTLFVTRNTNSQLTMDEIMRMVHEFRRRISSSKFFGTQKASFLEGREAG